MEILFSSRNFVSANRPRYDSFSERQATSDVSRTSFELTLRYFEEEEIHCLIELKRNEQHKNRLESLAFQRTFSHEQFESTAREKISSTIGRFSFLSLFLVMCSCCCNWIFLTHVCSLSCTNLPFIV